MKRVLLKVVLVTACAPTLSAPPKQTQPDYKAWNSELFGPAEIL